MALDRAAPQGRKAGVQMLRLGDQLGGEFLGLLAHLGRFKFGLLGRRRGNAGFDQRSALIGGGNELTRSLGRFAFPRVLGPCQPVNKSHPTQYKHHANPIAQVRARRTETSLRMTGKNISFSQFWGQQLRRSRRTPVGDASRSKPFGTDQSVPPPAWE